MARGSRKTAQRRRAPDTAAAGAGAAGNRERPRSDTGQRPDDDVSDSLFDPFGLLDPSHPFQRMTALFLLQALEWQSAFLDVYRRALQDGPVDVPVEDHLRDVARRLMTAYLEVVKSLPERRERLAAQHFELLNAVSETIDDLRQRLARPPSDVRPPRH